MLRGRQGSLDDIGIDIQPPSLGYTVADLMEASAEIDVKEYRDLTRSEAEVSRVVKSLATALRLTPQSVHDREKKKPRASRGWAPRDAGRRGDPVD